MIKKIIKSIKSIRNAPIVDPLAAQEAGTLTPTSQIRCHRHKKFDLRSVEGVR